VLQQFEFQHTAFFMWLDDPDRGQLICFHDKTIETPRSLPKLPSSMIHVQSSAKHYRFVSKNSREAP